MQEMQDLKRRLEQERPAGWEELPDLALYMDQIIAYMPRQLVQFDANGALTAAMVNNYIKEGLVPRAEGKRYGPQHLAYLTVVCALKQTLTVREIGALFSAGQAWQRAPEEHYTYFCSALDRALCEVSEVITGEEEQGDLPRLALNLALRGYAAQLACTRIMELLATREGAGEKKAKETAKKESK